MALEAAKFSRFFIKIVNSMASLNVALGLVKGSWVGMDGDGREWTGNTVFGTAWLPWEPAFVSGAHCR